MHTHALAPLLPEGEFAKAPQLVHTLSAVAPVAVEYLPARQSEHAKLPVTLLYLPATHGAQVLLSGPVEPALHLHAASIELPAGALDA